MRPVCPLVNSSSLTTRQSSHQPNYPGRATGLQGRRVNRVSRAGQHTFTPNREAASSAWISSGNPSPCLCRASSSSADVDEMQQPWGRVLRAVNESTKWVVSAAVATFLLWRHDLEVVWCVLGSFVNVVICKALKKVLKHERPAAAVKSDHGMPSSHAQSLAYLAVYAASSIHASGVLGPQSTLAAGGALALGSFMAWLRVATNYHTPPQVVVGFVLGGLVALSWQHLGLKHVLPQAQQHGWLVPSVYTMTMIGILTFVAGNLRGVRQDLHRLKLAMQQ